MKPAVFVAMLIAAASTRAQDCPPLSPQQQEMRKLECQAAGGEWARFGVRDHLCGVYSCAARTKDAGKPCRNRFDCEHLCITDNPPKIGTEVVGHCAALKTMFGCFTHVDGGRIVGRVCVD